MNSGQQLLTIFVIVIFGFLSLNVYKSSGSREDSMRYNEAAITATGIAQAMINEIESKAFDQTTVYKSVSTADSLTPPNSLGPDGTETVPTQFNDIDDYNDYTTTDTLNILGNFNVKVKVFYIQKMSPDVVSYTQTFSKQVNVSVTNMYLPDTLKFSQVISY